MTSIAQPSRGRPAQQLRTIAVVAVCTFMAAWLFLAWQLRAGHDPALGTTAPAAKHAVAPTAHNPAPVLVTRTSGGG